MSVQACQSFDSVQSIYMRQAKQNPSIPGAAIMWALKSSGRRERPGGTWGRAHVRSSKVRRIAIEMVVLQLQRIAAIPSEDGHIEESVRPPIARFVNSVAQRDSLPPSIGPDDGDAILHWVAGEWKLEVHVSATGPCYLWLTEPGSAALMSTQPDEIHVRARAALASMTATVSKLQPNWATEFTAGG